MPVVITLLCRSQEISQHAESEARDSARQLVALQQRLATLKDAVAAAQRVAAAREAAAAAAIQRNAAETAAELQKQDVDKQINQSEREAKVSNRKIVLEYYCAQSFNFFAEYFSKCCLYVSIKFASFLQDELILLTCLLCRKRIY